MKHIYLAEGSSFLIFSELCFIYGIERPLESKSENLSSVYHKDLPLDISRKLVKKLRTFFYRFRDIYYLFGKYIDFF